MKYGLMNFDAAHIENINVIELLYIYVKITSLIMMQYDINVFVPLKKDHISWKYIPHLIIINWTRVTPLSMGVPDLRFRCVS
jgi:hypothetical protein